MPPRKRTTKSTAKKTTSTRPKVKMIQTIDSVPGKDTTVYFTDGTHAVIKADNKLSAMLSEPECVAPNLIQVTISRGQITDAERVDTSAVGE